MTCVVYIIIRADNIRPYVTTFNFQTLEVISLRFTKMQGAGNDFIIINNIIEKLPVDSFPGIARTLCARRVSIGADGLMAVVPASNGGDYAMLFYNSDGSLGEMCGNGARCICRYGYENGLAGDIQRVETTAGLVTGERIDSRQYRVRLNDPSVIDLHREICGYDCAYVELGSPGLPHVIVMLDDWDEWNDDRLRALGSDIRYSEKLYKGANVSFVKIVGRDRLKAVTYERGVEDFTLACGTASGSMTAVLTLKGLVSGKDVHIDMPGGVLTISLSRDGDTVHDIYLTGPTNIVCVGDVTDEELKECRM